jgi:hypothetical protein
MALPFFGQISLGNIQSEFGGDAPTAITEYYRGGAYTPSGRLRVPTSGLIKLSDFYTSNNTGSLTHVFNDETDENILTDGTGASFTAVNLGGASAQWTGSFNAIDKYYTVIFFNPFPNNNYSITVTITDNRSASGFPNNVVFGDIAGKNPGYFSIQFVASIDNRISYVRQFQAACDWLG